MPLDLYYIDGSSPCRAVWMLLKAMGLDFSLHTVDLMKKEQMKEEFLQINPMHCVPTLDDGGFRLWESRSIMRYLMNKYAKSDELYPKDPQKRAVVDRLLDYDLGTVYRLMGAWVYPQLFQKSPPDAEKEKEFNNMLDDLNKIHLAKGPFLTGDQLTIADLSMIASLSFADVLDYDYTRWENVHSWMTRCKALPYYEECAEGLMKFKAMFGAKK